MTPPIETQRETATFSRHGFWLTSCGTFTTLPFNRNVSCRRTLTSEPMRRCGRYIDKAACFDGDHNDPKKRTYFTWHNLHEYICKWHIQNTKRTLPKRTDPCIASPSNLPVKLHVYYTCYRTADPHTGNSAVCRFQYKAHFFQRLFFFLHCFKLVDNSIEANCTANQGSGYTGLLCGRCWGHRQKSWQILQFSRKQAGDRPR